MTATFDHWLTQRAAAGDRAAFTTLLKANRTKLRNVALSFRSTEIAIDDLEQIAVLKLWTEVQRGHYNPHRGDFVHFASTVFSQALRDDKVRRHAAKRWDGQAPVSLDLTHEDSDAAVWIAPSWHQGADPANVVIQREQIQLAWELLTRQQTEAVNLYLRTDGVGAPATMNAAMAAARKRVRPMLAAEDGVHPTLDPAVRSCAHCGKRMRMIVGQRFCGLVCKSAGQYRDRRQLAEHSRQRRELVTTAMAVPVRLV